MARLTDEVLWALPAKQRQVAIYLRDSEDPWVHEDVLVAENDSTQRGMGNVLNRLLDQSLVTCRGAQTARHGMDWGLRERVRPDVA